MTGDKTTAGRLIGLFLLGLLLFNFPLISLFNRPALLLGIPVLYFYLFAVWLLVILLMLLISRSKPDQALPDKNG
ncbi:hypothetical protein [uncultured Desulfosarcina sp.]|uniref:hypothetical protein n=1 Tax=uncultured Desulfosarcina sp. TaxID=218289 RepID=UPI0029C6B21D|nr:hypothetical protein [uncultured Desulfosarcina sp.]